MPLFKRKSDKKSAKDAPQKKAGSDPASPARKVEGKANNVPPTGHTGGARPKIQAAKIQTDRSPTQQDTQFGDLGHSHQGITGVHGSSRLNISLEELLHDNSAIPYFIQYMDTVGRQHTIKFWIEVDSFRSAAWTRIRAHTLTSMSKSLIEQTGSPPLDRKKLPTDSTDTKTSQLAKDSASKGRLEDANSNEVIQRALPVDRKSVDSLQSLQSTESVRTSHSAISNGDSSAKDDSGMEDKESKGREAGIGERQKNTEGDSLKKAIERDAVSIYSKYIAQDAAKPVGVTDEMRNSIVAKICSEDGHVDPNCFQEAQEFVVKVMERDHYQSYLKSEFHCKHQIDVLTSGDVFLADILYNDTALFYFMEFMEQEGAMNLLQFWLAANNFQLTLASKQGQYDGLEAQNDAMVLYDKYFSLQASSPLGVDEATRFEIENQICREGGPLPNCFEIPLRQTLTTIESMYFPTFLTSELYFKYLNELINTIKTDVKSTGSLPSPSPHHKGHRRQGSNASSEAGSVGSSNTTTTNTLLAGGVVHKQEKQSTKVIKGLDNDFRIDPHQFNPDQLWQRPNVGSSETRNMSVGRMNELGQFIPEYEVLPESERTKQSSASKLWKKYVSREPDEEKEEMAWKIAQMIVSNITRQTGGEELDSPDSDS
ncbi:A-kinase anchor protein 10, mitochondrial-like isoform X1 [Branchiostoma lanceolatum]|uniref:A-kinase anchor protein 10, mitochondrial-like isoform X1 n=1 Tax=Branchiostoma lanceolatum TaxID=7740 RepID=UPI003454CA01